ncbi:hypothetical protein [Bifidobacterium simiarum]|uniref:hypothetical protein n=1 Tax=Bifidobacterium simiarum TaxID=2045441 RepID=UPI001BDD9D47|nr:hypothetical protein [Bifidobacterium simiarum]MBT1166499.1 hypothetical protein [Bifidobacterium simiarum]
MTTDRLFFRLPRLLSPGRHIRVGQWQCGIDGNNHHGREEKHHAQSSQYRQRGLEYFPRLDKLYAPGNRLTSINVSQNTQLTVLDVKNYTTNKAEHDMLVRLGWKGEGVAWYAPASGKNVYRLYNRNSGEHVYTMSYGEYVAVQRAGWRGEGVAWKSL